MKKILDFIIIFLLIFLIINLFNRDNEIKDIVNPTIVFKSIESDYTVPAPIKIEIENKTDKTISLNTCKDIEIKYTSLDRIVTLPESSCKDIEIKSDGKGEINYSEFYGSFKDKWNYVFKTIIDEKEYRTNLEVESRWTFTKLFIYLFYAPAYNLIIFLVDLFSGSFGWAIIAITIFLRAILLWPQHKMLVSQKKLQAIQPKIKKIQEEFKGQPQVLGQKMMELYKTEKVNPMWSCGFLLIQMPILLVIYNVILYIEDSSNHYYLYSVLKDFEFNSINFSFYGFDLLGTGWIIGLILWITVWILQFTQIKLSYKNNPIVKKDSVVLEKKAWATDYSSMMPDPEVMQKFMLYWMPAMVAVFTYNFSACLWLYWGISTLFMIFQQLIVNKKK